MSAYDFDFWMGSWKVHNRRLVGRLAGSDEWEEFEGDERRSPAARGLGQRGRVPHGSPGAE